MITTRKRRRYYPGQQFSLLDTLPAADEPKPVRVDDSDDDLAYVYVATRGGRGKVIWKTTIGDAKKICQLPQSSGIGRGGPWMYCWTSQRNFGEYDGNLDDKQRLQKNDGRFDALFEEMGIEVTPV